MFGAWVGMIFERLKNRIPPFDGRQVGSRFAATASPQDTINGVLWTPGLESSTRREQSGGTEDWCWGSDTLGAGGPANLLAWECDGSGVQADKRSSRLVWVREVGD